MFGVGELFFESCQLSLLAGDGVFERLDLKGGEPLFGFGVLFEDEDLLFELGLGFGAGLLGGGLGFLLKAGGELFGILAKTGEFFFAFLQGSFALFPAFFQCLLFFLVLLS